MKEDMYSTLLGKLVQITYKPESRMNNEVAFFADQDSHFVRLDNFVKYEKTGKDEFNLLTEVRASGVRNKDLIDKMDVSSEKLKEVYNKSISK